MEEITLEKYRMRTAKPTLIIGAIAIFAGLLLMTIFWIIDSIYSSGSLTTEPNPALDTALHRIIFSAIFSVLIVVFVAILLYTLVCYFLKKDCWGMLMIYTFVMFISILITLSLVEALVDAIVVSELALGDQWIIRYMNGPTIIYEVPAVREITVNAVYVVLCALLLSLIIWNYMSESKVKSAYKNVVKGADGKECVTIESEKICWFEEK